jgi:hypothetical protein
MKIPTVAAVKKSVIAFASGIYKIEVGLRDNAEGEWVAEMSEWIEDADLSELDPLRAVLARWRKNAPKADVRVDLYLYHEWDGLVTNLDLLECDGEWFLSEPPYGHREEVR